MSPVLILLYILDSLDAESYQDPGIKTQLVSEMLADLHDPMQLSTQEGGSLYQHVC